MNIIRNVGLNGPTELIKIVQCMNRTDTFCERAKNFSIIFFSRGSS